jgi:hypothetical protein
LGPAALQQGESGRRREVAGEGQAEAEAAGVVGTGRLVPLEQLLEEDPALVGDPVDLARSLGAEGAAEGIGATGVPPDAATVTAPDRSRRDNAG